jgi:hypothetical protein
VNRFRIGAVAEARDTQVRSVAVERRQGHNGPRVFPGFLERKILGRLPNTISDHPWWIVGHDFVFDRLLVAQPTVGFIAGADQSPGTKVHLGERDPQREITADVDQTSRPPLPVHSRRPRSRTTAPPPGLALRGRHRHEQQQNEPAFHRVLLLVEDFTRRRGLAGAPRRDMSPVWWDFTTCPS